MLTEIQLEQAIAAFVTFFVLIDAPGVAPIFASLTAPGGSAYARKMAMKSVFVAGLILFFFAFAGAQLLHHLGISLDAFRVAGGVLLFLIALEMVFEKRQQRREERAEKVRATPEIEDVAVFPMAMPMLAGPGSIATVMLLMSRAEGTPETLVILGAMGAVMLLSLLALLAARPLLRLMGAQVEAVITRLLGVLLAALAAQYVMDGIKGVMA